MLINLFFILPTPKIKKNCFHSYVLVEEKKSKEKRLKEKERAGKRGKERKSQRILKRGSV